MLLVPDIKVKGKSSWQIYQKSNTIQEQLFYDFIEIKKIIISENNEKIKLNWKRKLKPTSI